MVENAGDVADAEYIVPGAAEKLRQAERRSRLNEERVIAILPAGKERRSIAVDDIDGVGPVAALHRENAAQRIAVDRDRIRPGVADDPGIAIAPCAVDRHRVAAGSCLQPEV